MRPGSLHCPRVRPSPTPPRRSPHCNHLRSARFAIVPRTAPLGSGRVGSEQPRENLRGSRTVASAAGRDLAVDVLPSVVLLGGVEVVGPGSAE